jgi:hypothetical protein
MSGHHRHDQTRHRAHVRVAGAFVRQHAQKGRGQDTKPGGNVATDVVQRHGVPQGLQRVVDKDTGQLHPGVNGSADRSAQRVPHFVVVPFEKLFHAMVTKVDRGAVVEPWVKLVNDIAVHGQSMKTNLVRRIERKDDQQSTKAVAGHGGGRSDLGGGGGRSFLGTFRRSGFLTFLFRGHLVRTKGPGEGEEAAVVAGMDSGFQEFCGQQPANVIF